MTEMVMRTGNCKQRREKEKEGKGRSQIWGKKREREKEPCWEFAIGEGKICGQEVDRQRDVKSSTMGEKRN